MKRYGQWCGVARALDVVGDRWAMLIVRDLLPGPQRYSDLQAGLPGIGTNVLVERLRALQQAGVVTRRTLPPPAGVPVYELTEAGRALMPALSALREWGARHGSKPLPGDINRPSWMLLSLMSEGRDLAAGRRCELRVDGEVFTVSASERGIAVESGADRDPQATVTVTMEDLTGLMTGRRTRKAARSRAQVDGDEAAALELLAALEGALVPEGALNLGEACPPCEPRRLGPGSPARDLTPRRSPRRPAAVPRGVSRLGSPDGSAGPRANRARGERSGEGLDRLPRNQAIAVDGG